MNPRILPLLVLLHLIAAAPVFAQIAYDDLASAEDAEARIELFLDQTPEVRYELAHEHYSRWLAANHDRFSPIQMKKLLKIYLWILPSTFETTLSGEPAEGMLAYLRDELRPFLTNDDFSAALQPGLVYHPPIAE